MNPICPHCKREIGFMQSLKIGNPFYFKCPLCKTRVKQFDLGLLIIGLIFCAFIFANTIWLMHQIFTGTPINIFFALSSLIIGSIVFEYITHKYLAKHGMLKNDVG